MAIEAILNELGQITARGECSVQYRTIHVARPRDEKETLTLDLTNWLGSATLSSRSIEEYGTDATDGGVSSNVWTVQFTTDGYADLFATASDGRIWSGQIHMVDTACGPWINRYR